MTSLECLYDFFTQQNILYFLKNIEALRQSSEVDFYTPVLENASLRDVHELYKKIVYYPTSLKRIKEKCISNQNYYPLVGHFLSELKLLVNNAILFNKQELRPEISKFEEKVLEMFPLYAKLKADFEPYGQITMPPTFLYMIAGRMMVADPTPAFQKAEIKIEARIDLAQISQKKFWQFSKFLFEFEEEKIDFTPYKDVKASRTTVFYPISVQNLPSAPLQSKSIQDIIRERYEQSKQYEASIIKTDESLPVKEEMSPISEAASIQITGNKQVEEIFNRNQQNVSGKTGLSIAEIILLRKQRQGGYQAYY